MEAKKDPNRLNAFEKQAWLMAFTTKHARGYSRFDASKEACRMVLDLRALREDAIHFDNQDIASQMMLDATSDPEDKD